MQLSFKKWELLYPIPWQDNLLFQLSTLSKFSFPFKHLVSIHMLLLCAWHPMPSCHGIEILQKVCDLQNWMHQSTTLELLFPRQKLTDHNINIDFYLFIVKMLNSRVPQVYRMQIAFLFIINIALLCAFINMNFAGIKLYDSNFWPIAEIAKELGRIEHQYLSSPTSGDQKNLKVISVFDDPLYWERFNVIQYTYMKRR